MGNYYRGEYGEEHQQILYQNSDQIIQDCRTSFRDSYGRNSF